MADLEKDFDKEPDISKQFDSESDLHAQFDKEPSQGMGESTQIRSEVEKPTQLSALGRGAAQGLTLGFGDEIYGAGRGLLEKVNPSESTKDMPLSDLYSMYRDIQRAKNKQAEEAFPKTYLAGNVAGGFAPAIATGGSLPALIGTGAAMGLGASESEDVGGMAKDTAIGAGLGALGAGAGKVVGKGISLAGKGLGTAAEKIGISKSAGELKDLAAHQMEGAAKIPVKNLDKGLGEVMLEEGLDPSKPKELVAKVAKNMSDNRQELNQTVQEAQNKLSAMLGQKIEGQAVDPSRMLDVPSKTELISELNNRLNTELGEKYRYSPKDWANIQQTLKPFLTDITNNSDNITALNNVKEKIYQTVNSLGKDPYNMGTNTPVIEALKIVGNISKRRISSMADAVEEGLGGKIDSLNQKYGQYANIKSAGDKLLGQEFKAPTLPIQSMGAKDVVKGAIGAIRSPIKSAAKLAAGAIDANAPDQVQMAQKLMGKAAKKTAQSSSDMAASKITAEKAIASPFTQDVVSGRNNNLNQGYMVYQASDEQLKNYYNQIKDKPTLSSVSGALDRYFKTGDVMDKNKAAFLIQSTPEAKEALGLQ